MVILFWITVKQNQRGNTKSKGENKGINDSLSCFEFSFFFYLFIHFLKSRFSCETLGWVHRAAYITVYQSWTRTISEDATIKNLVLQRDKLSLILSVPVGSFPWVCWDQIQSEKNIQEGCTWITWLHHYAGTFFFIWSLMFIKSKDSVMHTLSNFFPKPCTHPCSKEHFKDFLRLSGDGTQNQNNFTDCDTDEAVRIWSTLLLTQELCDLHVRLNNRRAQCISHNYDFSNHY